MNSLIWAVWAVEEDFHFYEFPARTEYIYSEKCLLNPVENYRE